MLHYKKHIVGEWRETHDKGTIHYDSDHMNGKIPYRRIKDNMPLLFVAIVNVWRKL